MMSIPNGALNRRKRAISNDINNNNIAAPKPRPMAKSHAKWVAGGLGVVINNNSGEIASKTNPATQITALDNRIGFVAIASV